MSEIDTALTGTTYLSPSRYTAFYDRYHKQLLQTLAWLQQATHQAATKRDLERRADHTWLMEKRQLLAQFSGFDQALRPAAPVELTPLSGGASAYQMATIAGELYTGLLWEPAPGTLRGVVILAGHEAATEALVADYQAQGLRVILPCLARFQHSFAADPVRKGYFFTDDELLNLLFFIVGGSLAGMEAAELLTITRALTAKDAQPLPVALHLAGRHTLTATIAAALAVGVNEAAPQLYSLLVLSEEVGLLDHQADDQRVNTIWNFHTHFDALTLLQMAQGTALLFVEPAPTPSACYGRALGWFKAQADANQAAPQIERLVAPSSEKLASAVAAQLSAQSSPAAPPPTTVALDHATFDALYQRAFISKLAHLERLHTEARQRLHQRYALADVTPEQYRQRVAESLDRTAGPALPETTDRRAQTRCILRRPAYDLYEVVLESVPGVEVAGYLLLPPTPQPAPAIICQHGLGGRPDGLVGFEDRFEGLWVYDRFPQRLAEKGYVTFVPFMNWGWPQTSTRDQLVKLAYGLGFAPNRFEVAQLHAIVDFLQTRPEVIADRIAFYGLSYGGHASLWLCAHEPRLTAVLTAGHFNDWQTKLTSLELSPPLVRPTSFVSVDEGYDMFNYNVLNELGHAELVTRFAPRPHFIENGLQDAVTPTAWVDREFARVQAVFDWLGAADQTELEHFAGPHRVWSEGSFRFLHRHLLG